MSNELKIGIVVLVAAFALFFGIRFLQGLPLFESGYDVVVAFDDSQGLSAGSAVRLSGVSVGAVRDVQLVDGGRDVLVTLGVESDVDIPRMSTFSVGGFAALGDVYVSIEPPEGASAGRPLTDGDTVRAATGTDLMSLLTDSAGPLALRADTLLGTAVTTFQGVEGLVSSSSADLERTIANLRFITTATTQLLLAERERVGGITAALERAALSAERSALVAEGLAAEYGEAFSGQGAVFSDSLTATLTTMNARLRQLDTTLTGLDNVSARLDTTLTLVNSPDGSVGLMLRDPSFYYNVNATAASLEQLLTDFQNNPSRYLEDLRIVDLF